MLPIVPGELEERMTDDVRATIEWLFGAGYKLEGAKNGTMQSGVIELTGPTIGITVTQNRGQWMLDFHVGREQLDLQAVSATRTGDEPWSREIPHLPEQIPFGVPWLQEVPACLDWIGATESAVADIRATQKRRGRALFG